MHLPGAADARTVINAMRHADPQLVTFLFNAFSQMATAAHAIPFTGRRNNGESHAYEIGSAADILSVIYLGRS
jgi:hypothetical protein